MGDDEGWCYIESVKTKRGGKTLLHELTTEFPVGVTAILGPSGTYP
jgi:hypothetical protein